MWNASAPPNLYTDLPLQPPDFRIGKVNEIASELDQDVVHYRLVQKKNTKE